MASAITKAVNAVHSSDSIEEVEDERSRLIERLEDSDMSAKEKRLALGVFHGLIREHVGELRASQDEEGPPESLPLSDNPRGLPMSCVPEKGESRGPQGALSIEEEEALCLDTEEQTMDKQPRPEGWRPHRSHDVT